MTTLHDASDAIAAAAALGATIPAPVGTQVHLPIVEWYGFDDDWRANLGVFATRDGAFTAAIDYLTHDDVLAVNVTLSGGTQRLCDWLATADRDKVVAALTSDPGVVTSEGQCRVWVGDSMVQR